MPSWYLRDYTAIEWLVAVFLQGKSYWYILFLKQHSIFGFLDSKQKDHIWPTGLQFETYAV